MTAEALEVESGAVETTIATLTVTVGNVAELDGPCDQRLDDWQCGGGGRDDDSRNVSDPNWNDTHVATIDWGDGRTSQRTCAIPEWRGND